MGDKRSVLFFLMFIRECLKKKIKYKTILYIIFAAGNAQCFYVDLSNIILAVVVSLNVFMLQQFYIPGCCNLQDVSR